jgi:acetyltransferase-like isoleucine patch superfamily enzyme
MAISGWCFSRYQSLFGRKVGRGFLVIGQWPNFKGKGRYLIERDVRMEGTFQRSLLDIRDGAVLTIGRGTYLNDGLRIHSMVGVTIGSNCLVANNVSFFDSDFHAVEEGSITKSGPIVLGRNVWIGAGVIILANVSIGDHSVIGAGSVVTRPIPANTLAAGNPCRRIRAIKVADRYRRS